ncbi:MAG: rRNA methyltransferase [Bacteroidota bacterium]|jgi:phospholipid N-methyltransferase
MGIIKFFLEGMRDIQTVGTIASTSSFTGRRMLRQIDFSTVQCIAELGAGDGVITKEILAKMSPNAKLISFEINPRFCEELDKINDSRLIVINDSAEKVAEYLAKNGFGHADHVISALPFSSLPVALGESIVTKSRDALKKGGLYVQIHYSLHRKPLYQRIFGNVDWEITTINVPPAFILTSIKE